MKNISNSTVRNTVTEQTLIYVDKLATTLKLIDSSQIATLVEILVKMMTNNGTLYICGNGGSAANAMHLANDFTFGISPSGDAMKVEALTANSSIVTCLANDIGYENIFSHQLKVKASHNDVLLILSGSGNSQNVIQAVMQAKKIGMPTVAILGFHGGKIKELVDLPMHIQVMDMQISEDSQLIIGHIVMQSLFRILNIEN